MDTLKLVNVEFRGRVNHHAIHEESLKPFSHQFSFGKSYLLAGEDGSGGWALSWIVGGQLEPDKGNIFRNNIVYPAKIRKQDSWFVWHSQIKRIGLFGNQYVSTQIRHGLRTIPNQYLSSEDEIIKRFHLTFPERYHRRLEQLSGEQWRASCAIGLVYAKKLFCFPQMPEPTIEHYHQLWLKNILEILKNSGALVLLPTKLTSFSENLCDEIITI